MATVKGTVGRMVQVDRIGGLQESVDSDQLSQRKNVQVGTGFMHASGPGRENLRGVELLASHFTPTTVVHRERRMFFAAKRGEQGPENINMWIARIKRLSSNCKFGNHLEHNLTNKFITGLSGRALDRICEEDENVSFEKARELALKYELEEDRKNVEAEQVNIVRQRLDRPKNEESRWRSQPKPSKGEIECYVCGRSGHIRANCRFRNSICNSCGKKGHLAAVCTTGRKHYVWRTREHFQRKTVPKNASNPSKIS